MRSHPIASSFPMHFVGRKEPPRLQHPCAGTFIQENFGQFTNLLDLLPVSDSPAIFECPHPAESGADHELDVGGARKPLTHVVLHKFINTTFPKMMQVFVHLTTGAYQEGFAKRRTRKAESGSCVREQLVLIP
jgi:hypothetical protein